ncbi:zinc finger, CCHC-type containing protein [Tanacetum coccineum]
MRLRLFQFSLRDQASNWLERLPTGSISTWEDLTTRFLAQFFPSGRTTKLRNDILMFQQHHGESLSEAWTRFKDLLQKVPHHGINLWLQVQIFYDHIDCTTQEGIDYAAGGRLRKLRPDEAWDTIERLAQYENEGWNDTFTSDEDIIRMLNLMSGGRLSVEPQPHVFKKKSLIMMGVIMKLHGGMCVWPRVMAEEEEDNVDDEGVRGDAGHGEARGSADLYNNMSQGDWQAHQAH